MDDVRTRLKEAVQYHVSGRLNEAAEIYRSVLDSHPEQPDALNLLGLVANATGKHALAETLIKKAVTLAPARADYAYNLGLVMSTLGKIDEAISAYGKAIQIDPDYPDPLVNLSVIFQRRGRLDEAIGLLEKAASLKPGFGEALYNLGNAYYARGDREKAVATLRQAVQSKPDYVDALFNLGVILRGMAHYGESETCMEKVLHLCPDHVEAWFHLGLICYANGRMTEAFHAFKEAVRLKPDHLSALNNVGHICQERGEYDEAIHHYRTAINLHPRDAHAHFNLGTALQFRGYVAAAFEAFSTSLSLMPDNPSALFARGETRLAMGQLKEGFGEYQARLAIPKWGDRYPPLPGIPLWDGTSLAGRTILVRGEQGFGDTFQFARYLTLVKQKGGRVFFEVKAQAAPLFEGFAGVDRLMLKSPVPDLSGVDCYIHLLSLPHIFQTTMASIPPVVPFGFDRSKRLLPLALLSERPGPKVGLVWAGAPVHLNDRNRSLRLDQFGPLFDGEEVTFFSLQKGEAVKQLVDLPSRKNIIDLSSQLHDFLDTALAIESLDLVITVDTSVAHLAGTLGIPTWVVLPFAPDFRWLLDREDSPWYPSVRLFRQETFGQWEEVVDRLKQNLVSAYLPEK